MMYVNKANLAKSAGLRAQHQFITNMRKASARYNHALAEQAGLNVNADIPAQAWLDFDRSVVRVMTDPVENTLVNDLMPLARNVGVGKIVTQYGRSGGEFEVRTSIDGEHAKPTNHVDMDVDGNLILIHSTQVGRSWREVEGMREEGFDELATDVEVATRDVLKRTGDNFVNGTPGLTFKGTQSTGIKTNPNTQAVTLDVDLTDPAITFAEAYTAIVNILRLLPADANLYFSDEIWFNLMRINPAVTVVETLMAGLQRVPGVAAIKRDRNFTGNQLAAIVVRSEFIRPVVGMPVTSTPIERKTPMDKFNILVWGASGLEIRGDVNGRSGVVYAEG